MTLNFAAIYCRLSQDREGAGLVVERQERDCRELAARLGWQVTQVFTDNDVSAYRKRRRPGYDALMAALRAGKVDGVLAWHTDRLHRSPTELEDYIAVCEPQSIVTSTVRAGHLDLSTAGGRMNARMLGAAARYEAEQISGRSRAGKLAAAAEGQWGGGQRVYGYDVVKVTERERGHPGLTPRPEEAQIVQEAAKRVLAGDSLRSVAQDLNRRGQLTTTGKQWTGSAVRKVLLRPLNAAQRTLGAGGELVQGNWDPLLEQDVWRGLRAVLNDPMRRTTEQRARRYLGSGIYKCVCGSPMTGCATGGGWSGDHGGGRAAAYRCRQAEVYSRGGMKHAVRSVAALDGYVIKIVIARLSRPDALTLFERQVIDSSPLYEERTAIRSRLESMARGWALGALTESALQAASDAAKQRLAEIDEALGQAGRGTVLDSLVGIEDVAAAWASLSLDRQRAVVDSLIEVTVLPRRTTGRLPGGAYFDPECVQVKFRGAPPQSVPRVGRPLYAAGRS